MMELNQPGLPSPEEMDDGLYHFIRENNDQGVALRQEGDLDEAIANYDRVLSIKGDVAVVHNNRGVVWLEKGRPDRAISDFDMAYLNRGLAWCAKNRPDAAFENFSRVLELEPELLKAYPRVSEYLKNGSMDRVCRQFK